MPRPSTVGRPSAAASHGSAGRIGLLGERAVAELLEQLDLPPHVHVLHDLSDPGGDGNVDHAVIAGNRALLIDTKTWAHGTYTTRLGRCHRDRNDGNGTHRFEPGDLEHLRFVTGKVARHIGFPRRHTATLLAVVSPNGTDVAGHDLSGFSAPRGVQVVAGPHLAETVTRWVAANDGPTHPVRIARAAEATSSYRVGGEPLPRLAEQVVAVAETARTTTTRNLAVAAALLLLTMFQVTALAVAAAVAAVWIAGLGVGRSGSVLRMVGHTGWLPQTARSPRWLAAPVAAAAVVVPVTADPFVVAGGLWLVWRMSVPSAAETDVASRMCGGPTAGRVANALLWAGTDLDAPI